MRIPTWWPRRAVPLFPALVPALAWLVLAAGGSATGATAASAAAPAAAQSGVSRVAQETPESARVGALFRGSLSGGHFCTASVVDSPGRSLILTAAHCLSGKGTIVFAPGYRNGKAPYGVWQITKVLTTSAWRDSSDEDTDVALAVVAPLDGDRIEDVVGGNDLGTAPGYSRQVTLIGYPQSKEQPLICSNTTSRFSSTQLRIACTAYTGGTSGSPWITDIDGASHTGTVIGVIGGYRQGGDSPDVSYSSYFGDAVAALYAQAVEQGG